jgi:membrane protease subunit (stomatin/prohibitin family)
MALMDFIKKQFIDIIHWTEDEPGVLAYRFPMADMEIQYGASLTVRESQMAVFVNEGKIADVFGPGQYKLVTQTIPVLTYLKNWDKLFESPFKSDVYFFSTRQQVDQKFGTPNPITIRDAEFGAVRIRLFGIYSYRIADPKLFHQQVSGTTERYMADSMTGQLRNSIIGSLTDLIAESKIPFLDMAANQDEFAGKLREKVKEGFSGFGLELSGFVIENISLPEELQKMLDQRISMNMIGDMQKYTQFQVASHIGTAAANPGGLAGIGAGLATGVAMGQQMASALGSAMQPLAPGAPPAAAAAAPAAAAPAPQSPQDITALLEKLGDLKAKGILTDEEFSTKKAELLKKLL